jgi:small-conductance mechanosensitive channel
VPARAEDGSIGQVVAVAWQTVLHVALTVAAFGLGLLVGWLWWGRQFVRARLTRAEAISIMQDRLERELAAKDAEIARLLDSAALPGAADREG